MQTSNLTSPNPIAPSPEIQEAQVSTASRAPANSPGVIERFLDSFFQEKNIKWMLIVGAAIVFGSSLMLVTKAWPEWSATQQFLSIIGYTTVIFLGAEVSRRRLNLNATYKVLQTLTLLLLPICFLSLDWLSAGTAVQSLTPWLLMVPALLLLWQASTRILDHWLRGRQATFLLSFGLLCAAGALPVMTSPIVAFGFIMICWLAMTAGALKVNRHTFWLAESHRLPRVFGFLPVLMLGLQFVILVGTKAITAVPVQWLGLATVLVAATVLLTARSVAEVFRQRTGDLVRPLPWPIIAPLFTGLVLAVLGVALSMVGFSYVGATTYAVVPTAMVAAIVFGLAARDTRHSGLVWGSLITLAIAYQCSPVMFADLVQTLRSATAEAINQERVPVSLYGLTYLPMLSVLTFASGCFARRRLPEFSQPIKHFVTALAVGLLAFAATNITSLFIVAGVNVIAFMVYAIAFRDRRYGLVSIVSLVTTVAVAIPACGQMGYTDVGVEWVSTALAGLALLLTISKLPDRLMNRIPLLDGWQLNDITCLFRRRDGQDRNVIQIAGCVLAVLVGMHWIMEASLSISQPLSLASLLQFSFLIAAMVVYTVRNPTYLSAACIWVLIGYATLRAALGMEFGFIDMAIGMSLALIATSAIGYLATQTMRWFGVRATLTQLRASFEIGSRAEVEASSLTLAGVPHRIAAFALPLLDISVAVLLLLTALFFVPVWTVQHWGEVLGGSVTLQGFQLGTAALLLWYLVLGWRSRDRVLGFATAAIIPVATTSLLLGSGFELSFASYCLTWAGVQGLGTLVYGFLKNRDNDNPAFDAMLRVTNASMIGLVALSCLSFDWPMRCVVLIAAVTSWRGWKYAHPTNGFGDLAIFGNVHLLLSVAALGGSRGLILPGIFEGISSATIANLLVFSALSAVLFDVAPRFAWARKHMTNHRTDAWSKALRGFCAALALMCFAPNQYSVASLVLVTVGFGMVAAAELLQAVERKSETRVWSAIAICLVAAGFLFLNNAISFGVGMSQFVLLGIGLTALSITSLAKDRDALKIFERPMDIIGHSMPAVVAVLAVTREFSDLFRASSTILNALALMVAAGIYFHQAYLTHRHRFFVAGTMIANVGLFFLWRSLGWMSAELYLVPFGLSMLALVELLKDRLPTVSHNPLRYIAVLTIMCSPLFEVIGGSWAHMLSLMCLSVVVILVAIGLRLRSLVYAGTAFLTADLFAMVIRSTIHNMTLLWIGGVLLGIAVIALAAFCENHREKLLARIRVLSAELATWN